MYQAPEEDKFKDDNTRETSVVASSPTGGTFKRSLETLQTESQNSRRLSNDPAAISLPPSSPIYSAHHFETVSAQLPARARRSPSTHSVASSASATPSLKKKMSMNSIHNAGGRTPPRSPASGGRRVSSSLLGGPLARPIPLPVEEPPPIPKTPGMVAKEYFQLDLQQHAEQGVSATSECDPYALTTPGCPS